MLKRMKCVFGLLNIKFVVAQFYTNRLSEATDSIYLPQAEAWGFVTITALRAEKSSIKKGNLK